MIMRYLNWDVILICNFRALFVTLINFVCLMSTITNHEHIVWSACGVNNTVYLVWNKMASVWSWLANGILSWTDLKAWKFTYHRALEKWDITSLR